MLSVNKLSLLLVCASALALSACGLKGDLYYPAPSKNQVHVQVKQQNNGASNKVHVNGNGNNKVKVKTKNK